MAALIEDYALIGDCHSAGLVARDGSLDWLCLPRFDSGACFAALLGTPEAGRWLLTPSQPIRCVRRRYRPGTLVLETEWETDTGSVTLIDFMVPANNHPEVIRLVEGKRGQVPMRLELVIRFDYGSIVPWVRRTKSGIRAVAGPDMIHLYTSLDLRGENLHTVADFTVTEGQRVPFRLTWYHSFGPEPPTIDADLALERTELWWQKWSSLCTYNGPWTEAVSRSLITLKALTYAPTGGISAAVTTSLPEQLGGIRNWDYRYCWLRDATFTLYAFLVSGYHQEAQAWREWLFRAVAGRPADLQIMYGLAGERRLTEMEIPWLPGYEGSRPVRIGNAAHDQRQLDVYGEIIDALYQYRRVSLKPDLDAWRVGHVILNFLESAWKEPDEGIWEVRGPRRHFTHSKVMAWVAFDRAVKSAERFGLSGPVDRWRRSRDEIHAQVCQAGFNTHLGAFVQYYGAQELDASLLMIPLVGFLPATDGRVRGTVAAIEKHLLRDGLVLRYTPSEAVDGLPAGEGVFLACSFWLADNLILMGRTEEARELFEHLLTLQNDVGLLSEEYDPQTRRLVGNFPQAFTHVGLVNTAHNFAKDGGPAEHRRQG